MTGVPIEEDEQKNNHENHDAHETEVEEQDVQEQHSDASINEHISDHPGKKNMHLKNLKGKGQEGKPKHESIHDDDHDKGISNKSWKSTEDHDAEEDGEDASDDHIHDVKDGSMKSEFYRSVMNVFKEQHEGEDVSAALVVMFNKVFSKHSPIPEDESDDLETQFMYHPVVISEKEPEPEKPLTPLWKIYRWKEWAIRKGLIPDPDIVALTETKCEKESDTATADHSSGTEEEAETNSTQFEEESPEINDSNSNEKNLEEQQSSI